MDYFLFKRSLEDPEKFVFGTRASRWLSVSGSIFSSTPENREKENRFTLLRPTVKMTYPYDTDGVSINSGASSQGTLVVIVLCDNAWQTYAARARQHSYVSKTRLVVSAKRPMRL